ncbi:hypothetical protein L1987_46525 [Smallanthus sonchifolius]|uniref:Uncharacterized protein n=1 Tax=Smallanthus sonchifolius TaxID=185202 RepID=A0ACB9G0J8_9ASTR|nr:hypothetical protein L1987_46525 [Smallanthus sonchifolius]
MTRKQLIDAYAGGDIGTKTPQEAYDLLEKVASKSYTQHTSRTRTQRQGVHQVDGITSLAAHVEALSTKIDQMQVHKAQSLFGSLATVASNYPDSLSAPHSSISPTSLRDRVPSFDLSRGQFQGQGSSSGPPPAPEGKSSLEDMVARLLANSESQNQLAEKQNRYMEERFHTHETELRNQKASIQTIENQVLVHESSEEEVVIEVPDETPPRGKPASTSRPRERVRDYTPAVPYPGRLKKQKMEEQYGKFLGLFKQLHINLPFVEALAQTPKYARFLKDILTNKRKLEESSQVTLNKECSAVIQNKLPDKKRDPGSFTIPCLIGSLSVSNALADLGASINLMRYAVFAKLELGEPTPTRMSIQLADRSVKYPRGIVANMLVKVDRFVFPALIDVYSGRLTLRVDEEEVTFDVGRSMQHTQNQDDSLYFVEAIYSCVSDHLQDTVEEESLDTQILGGEAFDPVGEDQFDEQLHSQESYELSQCSAVFTMVDRESEPIERPSIEDPPPVELKELPSHLEYAFLDGESRLPVIIASDLTSDEKERLLEVLKQHKQAIAWRIMDIKGINPSFYTHKILMEDDYKPVV